MNRQEAGRRYVPNKIVVRILLTEWTPIKIPHELRNYGGMKLSQAAHDRKISNQTLKRDLKQGTSFHIFHVQWDEKGVPLAQRCQPWDAVASRLGWGLGSLLSNAKRRKIPIKLESMNPIVFKKSAVSEDAWWLLETVWYIRLCGSTVYGKMLFGSGERQSALYVCSECVYSYKWRIYITL